MVALPTSRNDSRSEPEFLQHPREKFRFTPKQSRAVLFTSGRDARIALRSAMPTWSGNGSSGNCYWEIKLYSVFCVVELGGMRIWSEPWKPDSESKKKGRPHDPMGRASPTGP